MLFKAIILKNFVFAYCLLILYFNKPQNLLNVCGGVFLFFCVYVLCFDLTCFTEWSYKKKRILVAMTGCVCALAIENGNIVPCHPA